MDTLHTIVYPLTALLRLVFEFYVSLFGNYGISIVALSLTVTVLLTPISRFARRSDEREQRRQAEMAPQIEDIKRNYRGQERFERIDAVYTKFNYHPIKSMTSILPLLLQIPFLLAALFLLIDYPPIEGVSFLLISDLSKPDHLLPSPFASLEGINVLPLLLTLVSLAETAIKPGVTRQVQIRLLIVAAVLLVLIYPLPAAVCLYWLCTTFWSFLRTAVTRSPVAG